QYRPEDNEMNNFPTDTQLFDGLAGRVGLSFPDATAQQLQRIAALFSRGWSVETTITPGNMDVRLVHTAPELVAIVSFDPGTLAGEDCRLSWAVDDLSVRNGVTRFDGPDFLAVLIELADHLDKI